MRDITNYLQTERSTFAERPFSPADSLVLCQFSYLKLERVMSAFPAGRARLQELFRAELFEPLLRGTGHPDKFRRFFFAAAASPRFRDVTVSGVRSMLDKASGKQFCGMRFALDPETVYVAFRGTDSTVTGWKEDFELAFLPEVPSQQEALRYLTETAAKHRGSLIVGGHSKGGNLAEYAALRCSCAERIRAVYDHDGPGFKDAYTGRPEYLALRGRIHKYLPKSSLVGMLLEQADSFSIVESSGFWVLQHDPFNWLLDGKGDFIYADQFTGGADYFNKSLYLWLSAMTPADREKFTDSLFGLAEKCSLESLSELSFPRGLKKLFGAMREEDPETRRFLQELAKSFAAIYFQNLRPGGAKVPGSGVSS